MVLYALSLEKRQKKSIFAMLAYTQKLGQSINSILIYVNTKKLHAKSNFDVFILWIPEYSDDELKEIWLLPG